jgi:Flp pilus assembly protein TadD
MWHPLIAAGLLLSTALLSGCAVQRPLTFDVAPLAGQPAVTLQDTDILALSPAMVDFLDEVIDPGVPRAQRTVLLARATLGPGRLAFTYDPLLTLTAADAFERRSGNCLAFSSLFIAMARHVGLDAWYQEVPTPPQWSDLDGVWLLNLHVNVNVAAKNGNWVVDVSGRQPRDNGDARHLTDDEARALYLNNLGAEALLDHDLPRAYAYLRKAIGIAPRLPHMWSNLGVVYDRNGQTGDAIRAYELELQLDPVQSRAANNLFQVYQREGNQAAASRLQARVEQRRRRNPYYQYHLARQALAEHRYDDADRFLRRAIALNGEDYRFHYDLARVQVLRGETRKARKSLERAHELAPENLLLAAAGAGDPLTPTD